GGKFSSDLLRDFCRGEGILQLFTLSDSPRQNGIAERPIGLVMEFARTSMIHAAAPHFLWSFAVGYAAHQLNLWPRVSFPETSPTLRWRGKDVTFDESVPFYCLFPYRSAPPPPSPLFLAPSPPPVDPLQPQCPAPSSVSQVDPLPSIPPVQVAVGSSAAPGAASGGAASGGAEPGDARSEGAWSGGAEPEGIEPGGAESKGAESGGAEPRGAALSGGPKGASPRLSSQHLREWLVRRAHRRSGAPRAGGAGDTGAGLAAVTTGAGGTGRTAATGPGGARTSGAGTAGTRGVGCAGAGVAGVGGPGRGGARAVGAGGGGTGAGGTGAARAGAVDPGAGGALTTWTTLAALGFAPSIANSSLFLRTDTSLPPFYVLVYVDDLVFATANTEALTLVKSELQKRHTCTDLGELRSYLGLQITRDRAWRTITLTQSHMVHQVLQLLGFQFSSPQLTPLSTSHSLSASPADEFVEPSVLYVDNKAMIALCQEPRLEHSTKHIALRYFIARELQQRGQLRLAYVATRAITADVFTKALPPAEASPTSPIIPPPSASRPDPAASQRPPPDVASPASRLVPPASHPPAAASASPACRLVQSKLNFIRDKSAPSAAPTDVPLPPVPEAAASNQPSATADEIYAVALDRYGFGELTQSIATWLQTTQLEKILASPYIGISCDESTDRCRGKHLILFVTFIRDHRLVTEFMALLTVEKADAASLLQLLLTHVQACGVDLRRIVGISTDGASVMMGSRLGLVARLRLRIPHLVSCHCIAHREALAAKDAADSMPVFGMIDSTIRAIAEHLGRSGPWHQRFMDLQEVFSQTFLELQGIHNMR
ncbi:unnamed protein product, partial [Closterium sp. NIES-54]